MKYIYKHSKDVKNLFFLTLTAYMSKKKQFTGKDYIGKALCATPNGHFETQIIKIDTNCNLSSFIKNLGIFQRSHLKLNSGCFVLFENELD